MKSINFPMGKRVATAQKLAATISFVALLSMSAPVSAEDLKDTQAVGTNGFMQSLGVNTHMMNKWYGNAYANVDRVKSQLSYIGFKHARDCFCDDYSIQTQRQLSVDIGMKYNIWVYGGIYDQAMAGVKANADILDSVEGPNEADKYAPLFQGVRGLVAGVDQQKDMYAQIKADPATSNVLVNSLTLTDPKSIKTTGDISAVSDRTSSHIYPQWGGYNGELAYFYTQYALRVFQPLASTKQPIITEGGWWTQPHKLGVTEAVHAKYTLNFLLDAYKQGVAKTYLYELVDEYADPLGADMEQHFGLFKYDGSPKMAATALHNLTTLLADNGSVPTPDTLTYSLTGMPATAYSHLFQKSDGTFVLAIWNDARIWDNAAHKERVVKPVQILLSMNRQATSVDIYDPMVGTSPTVSQTGISGLTMSLPDHPILVFIKSPPPPPPPPEDTNTTIVKDPVNTFTSKRGGSFSINYHFAAKPMTKSYKVFVHFVDSKGNIVFQNDYTPSTSTLSWSGDMSTTRTVKVPATAGVGVYRIVAGVYDPKVAPYGGKKISAGEGVLTLSGNRYQIGTVDVLQ